MNFRANCICRDVVEVAFSRPALAFKLPAGEKIWRFPGGGGLKLAWLAILNISQRNCTLNVSEMRWIGLFLNRERSRFFRSGPITVLRPELPSKRGKVVFEGRSVAGNVKQAVLI